MSYATSAAALPNSPTPVNINRYLSTSIEISFPLRASIPRAPVFAAVRVTSLHRSTATNRLAVAGVDSRQLAGTVRQLRSNDASTTSRRRLHRAHCQTQHCPLNRRSQSQSTDRSHRQNRQIEQSVHVRLLHCAEQRCRTEARNYLLYLQLVKRSRVARNRGSANTMYSVEHNPAMSGE